MQCTVTDIDRVSTQVYKVFLKPEFNVVFRAGQYLKMNINSKSYAFSIASCPSKQNLIELHIGESEKADKNNCIISSFQKALYQDSTIQIDVPYGDAWLREDSCRPILLIAGGTGLSYVVSILKKCINAGMEQSIYLYWGVRNISLLYVHEELVNLTTKYSNMRYIPVSESVDDENFVKKGTVLDIVLSDFQDLAKFDIYMCGPMKMIKSTKEMLCTHRKASIIRMFSDALAYI
ncbi:putative flavin reductase LuxG [Candidatus Photodesmus katoptron Akat1]|uniref:Putative flavin reductase LuxG n=1 Tax=Candidatus Photodesmus katoptron Akat1 TaxID=1236703 RepID=S3DGA8_9GAMM|nr:putative flavin reductase LuxG [Candidatus Photodesmus katoptron Akat1]